MVLLTTLFPGGEDILILILLEDIWLRKYINTKICVILDHNNGPNCAWLSPQCLEERTEVTKCGRRTDGFSSKIGTPWTTDIKQLERPRTSRSQLLSTDQSNQYRTLNQRRASFRATPTHDFTVLSLGSFDRVSHRTSLPVDVEFVVCDLSNFVLRTTAAIYGIIGHLRTGSTLLQTRSEERRVGKEC